MQRPWRWRRPATGAARGAAVSAAPRRFPRLEKVQSQFRTIDTDRHFEIGLDALLHGLLDAGSRS